MLNVEVEIVSAANIALGDHFDLAAAFKGHVTSNDAFAALEIDSQRVAWTRPEFSTRTPVWHETFYFNNVRPSSPCVVYVMDKDEHKDELLGEAKFAATNTNDKETEFKLTLLHDEKTAGTVTVKVKSHVIEAIGDGKLLQYGPVHYSVHSSFISGLFTGTKTDDDKRRSLAYHVALHDINVHLPTDFQWNHHHQPVRRIFASNHPEAPVMRKMVQSEHDLIYKHKADTVYGEFREAADFFKLLHGGVRHGKSVLYTYVIIETGWYFSETGASLFKDMLSKHMLHSRAQFHVKYAGEFYVEQGPSGNCTLHIDNNSGTYAPPKSELPRVQALLESNFPGIQVQAVDRSNEEQKAKRMQIQDSWAK